MKITYYGHSSFGISYQGANLLFDPYITPNEQARHIDIKALPADYVLLSHGHGDHVADAEAIARHTQATIISNYEVATWYGKKDLQVIPMNHGGVLSLPFGTVRYVNAVHTSGLPDGSYGGYPGGFVVEFTGGPSCYFAGDTALTYDMKLIPLWYPKLDVAIFPVGGHFTMDYRDAVWASDFVGCNKVIGCHFDTFPPIAIDHAAAKKLFADKGKELTLPEIGQVMSY